jgi:hypothetical protein
MLEIGFLDLGDRALIEQLHHRASCRFSAGAAADTEHVLAGRKPDRLIPAHTQIAVSVRVPDELLEELAPHRLPLLAFHFRESARVMTAQRGFP